MVNRNASVDDTGEEVEEGQDYHKVSETISGVKILDEIAGIETEQVDCNHCHNFVEKLLDEPLLRIEWVVGHDEYHVGKVQQERE